MSGCRTCVWDTYMDDLEAYTTAPAQAPLQGSKAVTHESVAAASPASQDTVEATADPMDTVIRASKERPDVDVYLGAFVKFEVEQRRKAAQQKALKHRLENSVAGTYAKIAPRVASFLNRSRGSKPIVRRSAATTAD